MVDDVAAPPAESPACGRTAEDRVRCDTFSVRGRMETTSVCVCASAVCFRPALVVCSSAMDDERSDSSAGVNGRGSTEFGRATVSRTEHQERALVWCVFEPVGKQHVPELP